MAFLPFPCFLLNSDPITGIAKDEMVHLGLAGNILCSIGGTPRLYGNTPEFPAELFYAKLKLNLKPASKETIGLFRDVRSLLLYATCQD